MAEAIIFEVNIQDALTKLSNLQSAIELNKQAQQSYQEVVKSGADLSGEAAKQLESLKVANKNLGSEYRSAQRLLEGYTGAQKDNIDTTNFANNSVRQNRLLLKQLTEQYNDAKNPTAAFANQIKTLSDTLKRQESAIGDNRRSVGGYAEGIKQAFGELKIGNVQLSTLQDGLTGAANGFKAAGGGVKGFSAALATTGLPLIILGVQQLIDVFQKFKPVADAVEDATTAVSAAFNALVSGGNITEAVNQSLDLLNVLRDLEDTQAAFNLQQERYRGEIDKLIIQSKDRTKTEEQRQKLLNDAERLEQEIFEKAFKRNETLLNQQKANLLAKSGLSEQELKILAENTNAEAKVFQQIKDRFEGSKQLTEEDLRAYQASLLERAKLNSESTKDLEKIVNSRNKLVEKEEEERKKANEKAVQEREKQKAAEEKYRNDLTKLLDDFTLSERQKLEKSYTDKVNLIKGNNAQELALIDTINNAKEQALKKFDEDAKKRRQDEQKKFDDELKAIQTKQFNDAIQFNQKQAELDQQAVDLSVASEEEKAARKRAIQLAALEEQLALTKKFLGADGVITKEEKQGIDAIQLAIDKLKQSTVKDKESGGVIGLLGITEKEQEQINEGLAVISQSVSAIGEVINSAYQVRLNDIEAVKNAEIAAINASGASAEEKTKKVQEAEKKAAMEAYEIQKKQFETNKTIAIIQTVINTAQAVMAQLANPTPYVGIVLAALAAATGAAQIAVIASQKPPAPPAFADGGKVLSGQMIGANDGKPIQRGNGDNLLATVKTGEVILNQRQQAALGGAATFRKIGVPGFAAGGLVGDGGFAARGMTRASEDRSFMTAAIRSGFATAPQPIVTVEEFNKVSTSSQRSVAVSEL